MAKAVCSIQAGKMPAELKAAYNNKKSMQGKLNYIRMQLDSSTPNTYAARHVERIQQINGIAPGYIDSEHDAVAVLRVAAQGDLFDARSKAKKETKARSKKQGPTDVPNQEQSGSAGAAQGGSTDQSAAPDGSRPGGEETGKKQSEGVPDQPARTPEPPVTDRKVEQEARLAEEAKLKEEALRKQKTKMGADFEVGLSEELSEAIADIDTKTDVVYEDAVWTILDHAYDQPAQSGNMGPSAKKRKAAARKLTGDVSSVLWGEDLGRTMEILFDWMSVTISGDTNPKFADHSELWNLTQTLGIFPAAYNAVVRGRQGVPGVLPTGAEQWMKDEMAAYKVEKKAGVMSARDSATQALRQALDKLIHRGENNEAITKKKKRDELSKRISDLSAMANLKSVYRNVPLSEWVTKVTWTDGIMDLPKSYIETSELMAATDAKLDEKGSMDKLYEELEVDSEELGSDQDAINETAGIKYKIFDTNGQPITKPMSMGKVKLMVSKFASKLNKKVRPRIMVYKSVADFQKKAPKLYAEATKTGKINTNATGAAFNKTVVIFADNVMNAQNLAFTLSHEVIGHFGMASIMPEAAFKSLMDEVYASDKSIRNAADVMMDNGMEKYLAIEEALADAAASVDNSIIRRIAAVLKNFLNKLGLKFRDDMTRYFIHHSRRYQRTGQTPDVSAHAVFQELRALDQRNIAMRMHDPDMRYSETTDPSGNIPGAGFSNLPKHISKILKGFSTVAGTKANLKGAVKDIGRGLQLIQSMDNKALRNMGFKSLFNLMRMQKQRLESLKTKLTEITEWSNSSVMFSGLRDIRPKSIDDAPVAEELGMASQVLALINRHMADKAHAAGETNLKESPEMIELRDDGWFHVKEDGFQANRAKAAMTAAEINKGISVQKIDDKGRPAVQRDANDAIELDADGNQQPIMENIPLSFQLTGLTGERVMRLVEEQRLAIDTVALYTYLDKANGLLEDRNAEFKSMESRWGTDIDARESAVLEEVYKVYGKLYAEKANTSGTAMEWKSEDKKRARAFLYHATRLFDHEGSKIKQADWTGANGFDDKTKSNGGNNSNLEEFVNVDPSLKGNAAKDQAARIAMVKPVIAEMTAIAKAKTFRRVRGSSLTSILENMYLLDTQVTNADLFAKNTIQTAYVPLKRRGKYQVRVQAYFVNKDGNEVNVNLDPALEARLFYTRTDRNEEAERIRNELDTTFKGKDGITVAGADGSTYTNVKFRGLKDEGPIGARFSGSISYDDMATVLVRAGVNLLPGDRQKLVELTASDHSMARSNLRKDWTPGWDPNILHGVAEHLEAQSHIAAKNRYQHAVSRLMGKGDPMVDAQWYGDLDGMQKRQDAYEGILKTSNREAQIYAWSDLAKLQHMVVSSNGAKQITVMKQDGTKEIVEGQGEGNRYRSDADKIISGYHKIQGDPAASGDEILSEYAGFLMSGTAVMQLGGALAPAIVNMVSLETHTIPFLATLSKTGYGGGFGLSNSFMAVHRAGSDLSLIKGIISGTDQFGSHKGLEKILKDGTWSEYGLEKHEVEMLSKLTLEGVTTPNMWSALSGLATSGSTKSVTGKAASTWMIAFAKTEQFNRRVTALAAYRLQRQRLLASKGVRNTSVSTTEEASLRNFATEAVNFSQGNYDSFNRPAMAQGNIMQYVWMYKQFQVITVQLFRHLGHKERLAMLGMLIIMSGLKGIPFADDLADLIDTLMQMFDLKVAGVEAELVMVLNDLGIPSNLVMRGIVDYYFGATASTRLGMGDLIPGTGMFKAGTDMAREYESAFGPVYGAWTGVMGSAGTLGAYLLESVGIKDDTTSLTDVLKKGAGLSALKNYAKGISYMADGAIINDRGQVVSRNVSTMDALFQMIGFYPAAATYQYDVIRMSNQVSDYVKEGIKAAYKEAYIKADSNAERRAILKDVTEWNSAARGTPFYLRNFSQSVRKAVRSAKLDAVGRNLKTLPKTAQPFGREMIKSFGLDTAGTFAD